MSILARLLSRPYRLGLSAEADGDLETAAEAFARAGRKDDLARVRRLQGATAADPIAAAYHFRAALALMEEAGPKLGDQRRQTRRDLARLLLQSAGGEETVLQEAAMLFTRAGDHGAAADAFVRLGRISEAKEALARGRHFERLEELDVAEAEQRAAEARREAAVTRARDALATGRRSEALELIREAMEVAPEEATALLARIADRRPAGRMFIGFEGSRSSLCCVSENPVILGRGEESPLALRDPGISRHHAHIERSREHGWLLCDLESKNGTFIGGLPIADAFPMEQSEGSFVLGEHCRIKWRRRGEQGLILLVDKGLSAGSRLLALSGEMPLDELLPGALDARAIGTPSGLEGASRDEETSPTRPAGMLSWAAGWFVVDAFAAGRLCGQEFESGSRLELLHGDTLKLGGLSLEFFRAR